MDHAAAELNPLTDRPPRLHLVEAATDGELITRTAAGDHRAFDELYRRFRRPVLSLALRRLSDRGRAEDATQETFAAIWRSAPTYRPERGVGAPWLFTVARNAIVSQARLRAAPPAEVFDTPSDDPGPAEQAESEWASWCVHRALEALPGHERRLIELAYWGELSQSELASVLDVPLGTVKTRTRRALTRLAGELEREGLR
jgi:RNA polymerase sigma-70 factor (ECF subfamily)